MFKVINYSNSQLSKTMHSLAKEVESGGLTPSYVLGVLNGGRTPAELFTEYWNSNEIETLFYKLQRKTTGRVKSSLVKLIKRFPKFMVNFVRSAEMSFYSILPTSNTPITADENCLFFLRSKIEASKITEKTPFIIVDDAIDSGKTILKIVETLKEVGVDRACIKVIVVVHTLPKPLVTADYFKESGLLIRFPWSSDF
jgi:hypoxanthine phosphoribosyltransferase